MNELITLKQAASYLKVNEKIIEEMINNNIFNIKKVGKTIKIYSQDIQEWLDNLKDEEQKKLLINQINCNFLDFFKLENIMINLKANSKYDVIGKMSEKAKELKIVKDHKWLYNIIMDRESLASTAIGGKVALLHPRQHHPAKIKKPKVLFSIFPKGVDFQAFDNQLVKFVFLLLLQNDKQHLFCLKYISQFLSTKKNISALNKLKNESEILELLTSAKSFE